MSSPNNTTQPDEAETDPRPTNGESTPIYDDVVKSADADEHGESGARDAK